MIQLSIIIPVFNVERYVARCLNSLLEQDIDNSFYEIIVVNDGTQDDSTAIVRQYMKIYPNIILIDQENKGVSAARNRGIERARGNWLLFVDPDDSIETNSLGDIYHYLLQNSPEILVLKAHVYSGQIPWKEIFYPHPNRKDYTGTELFTEECMIIGVCLAVFSHSFIRANNIKFAEGIRNGEDSLFIFTSYIFASRIQFYEYSFYKIFIREDSASRSWNYKRIIGLSENLIVIKDFLNKNKLTKPQRSLMNYLAYLIITTILQRYFNDSEHHSYNELKKAIVRSCFPPISLYNMPLRLRGRMLILNISFDLYAFLFYIKQKIS